VSLDIVILAAGEGTRMKSSLPKVLHPLAGKPLVMYSIEIAQAVSQREPVLVIGNGSESVRDSVGSTVRFVMQSQRLGTGHAVMQARSLLQGSSDYVIVIYADMPLIQSDTLRGLHEMQIASAGPFSMLTLNTDTPRGFGRIIRNKEGSVQAIVEEALATPEQLAIREVNPGIYCFDANWLWDHVEHIPLSAKGEYFLTDLVEMAVREGGTINAFALDHDEELIGINTREHLAEAETILRRRINTALMLSGVTLVDPATTYIQPSVAIAPDTVILPNTHLRGATRIGSGCTIGPSTIIDDSTIGDACVITSSVIESATLEDHIEVGPFAHLRSGVYVERDVHIGNFGEIKNSRLRRGVKIGHFSYIGDADIGDETNVGAGTVTCNFDGVQKNRTVVGKRVFIGSDTMLVAPITLGDESRTGAGAVVTQDVHPGDTVVGVPARISKKKDGES
jgi:bifunctional UDP-N-acetylglucosamine pyrophosphorylase/glucosamine-1-phosphate N-acetyltransferase